MGNLEGRDEVGEKRIGWDAGGGEMGWAVRWTFLLLERNKGDLKALRRVLRKN